MCFTGFTSRRVIAAIAMLWASGLLGSSTAVAGGLRVHRVEDRYTPLVQSVVSAPKWFEGTDGRVHLVYELELTNGIPAPVTVSSVVVRDAGGGSVIARLHGSRLHAAMSLLATPGTSTTTVPASSIGVVWFDIALRGRHEVPRAVEDAVTWTVAPGLPLPATGTDTGARARVDSRPPVVLGPPLAGAGWVAAGSCCDGPHRRSLQPVNGHLYLGQRFAIDWNGTDSHGRFVVGDPDINANWVYYGKPVLAVADARVVKAVDRFPDQIPNHPKPVTIDQADGNYVILALGGGRFAFYAHLKPGSIRVRPGDRVRRGEVIAQLGNSGSSSGPHLHFQVMNRPSALASDGLPFVIDRFHFDGRIPPLDPALEAEINAGKSIPVDPAGAGGRSDELPLGRDVVDFSPRPRSIPGTPSLPLRSSASHSERVGRVVGGKP